jgi:hypothetical protein
MARTRLTYFFELGDTGWSESIHTTLSPSSISALQSLVNVYTTVRLPLLFQDAFLTHVRVSDDDQFRDISFFPTGLPAPGQATGAVAAGPWTGVLIRMIASTTLRRSLFLRGLPGNQHDGRNQKFSPAYQSAMNAYLAALPANPFGISGKSAFPAIPILSLVGATGVVQLAGPIAGLAVGSIIQLTGVPTALVPTRFYRVVSVVSGSNFTVAGWPTLVSLSNQGFFRLTTRAVTQISAATAGLITERKVGRPFGQLRGRSRR